MNKGIDERWLKKKNKCRNWRKKINDKNEGINEVMKKLEEKDDK